MGKLTIISKWPFSIAMLVDQRLTPKVTIPQDLRPHQTPSDPSVHIGSEVQWSQGHRNRTSTTKKKRRTRPRHGTAAVVGHQFKGHSTGGIDA